MSARPAGSALLLGALVVAPCAAAADWSLPAAAWARPRDGATVAAMQPLPAVVEAWSRRDGGRLTVRYAGGEEGELWAAELADWLVALGIPGDAIATVPGGQPGRLGFDILREETQ